MYSISYFQKLFDKKEVPKLSLFDVKFVKGIKTEYALFYYLSKSEYLNFHVLIVN